MTEEKYYLGHIHSIIDVSIQVPQPFLQKNYIADFFFRFAILLYIVQVLKCKLQLKLNQNGRGIWGFEFGLTEMCFPSPGLGH